MRDTEKLSLKNMVFLAPIGANEWERTIRTRIEVDLELYAYLKKACKSDSLSDTINYTQIYSLVDKTVQDKHHNLLESVASEIADAVFGSCDCDAVTVRVRKAHPPIGGACDCAEIEVVRHKVNRK